MAKNPIKLLRVTSIAPIANMAIDPAASDIKIQLFLFIFSYCIKASSFRVLSSLAAPCPRLPHQRTTSPTRQRPHPQLAAFGEYPDSARILPNIMSGVFGIRFGRTRRVRPGVIEQRVEGFLGSARRAAQIMEGLHAGVRRSGYLPELLKKASRPSINSGRDRLSKPRPLRLKSEGIPALERTAKVLS